MGAPHANRSPRRGLVALTLAVAIMLLLFSAVTAFTLTAAGAGVCNDRALCGAQALYAAEAGLDLALQRGPSAAFAGQLGRGSYAVRWGGGRLVAVGEVERAQGRAIRRAVAVRVSGRRVVGGTWREIPPAGERELVALLAAPASGQ